MNYDEITKAASAVKVEATKELVDHEEMVPGEPWSLQHVWYDYRDDVLRIWASHVATTTMSTMKPTTWAELIEMAPALADIDFSDNKATYTYTASGKFEKHEEEPDSQDN